jgi:mannosyltransferase
MVVIDGDTGVLVPAGDVDALVTALEPLMRDPERIAEMGCRARAHVVANFSSESEADRIISLYRQVWQALEGSR